MEEEKTQINIGAEDEPEKKEISEDTAIDVQMIVRDLLSKRQYDAAIDVLNEKLGATFLKDRPELHYRLEKQKMIDLLIERRYKAAYEFAPKFFEWADNVELRKDFFQSMEFLFDSKDVNGPLPSRLAVILRSFDYEAIITEMISFQGNSVDKVIKMEIDSNIGPESKTEEVQPDPVDQKALERPKRRKSHYLN